MLLFLLFHARSINYEPVKKKIKNTNSIIVSITVILFLFLIAKYSGWGFQNYYRIFIVLVLFLEFFIIVLQLSMKLFSLDLKFSKMGKESIKRRTSRLIYDKELGNYIKYRKKVFL